TMPVPSGVFTHPQVAWVGMDEETARRSGRQVEVAVQEYASIAYGWAMEDTTGFAKLVADAETTEILGAHLVGPEATTRSEERRVGKGGKRRWCSKAPRKQRRPQHGHSDGCTC